MKKTKTARILPVLAAAVMLLCAAPRRAEAASPYLERMNRQTGANYQEAQLMTREDFCAVVSRIFIRDVSGVLPPLPFTDAGAIKPENLQGFQVLYAQGILAGSSVDGSLYMFPDQTITRQEAVTFLGRALSRESDFTLAFTDAETVAAYAYPYVAWFTENEITVGFPDGSFRPLNEMTAGELSSLVIRASDYMRLNEAQVTTFAGSGARGYMNGRLDAARFLMPYGIVPGGGDGAENIVVCDTYNNIIRRIGPEKAETLAGGLNELDENRAPGGGYTEGPLAEARFARPTDGVFNTKGDLLLCDSANDAIRIVSGETVRTYAGVKKGHADGQARSAAFNHPSAIAIDKNDALYIADTLNHCIRKISPDGTVTTLAGTPEQEGFADGPSASALFRAPSGIAVTDDGSVVYVSDTGNHRIRKIENGSVSTLAGTDDGFDEDGEPLGGYFDGPAEAAKFNLPAGLTLAGDVLLAADSANHVIRAVAGGNVVTIAGTGEPGDRDGSALEASFSSPMGVCYHEGMLYIADTNNNKIKRIPFDSAKIGGLGA